MEELSSCFNECLMFAFQHFAYVNASNCQLEILEFCSHFVGEEITWKFEDVFAQGTLFYVTSGKYI